jgi:hypothetical protein
VGEPAVGTDRQKIRAQRLKILVLGSNCRQFGGSNKGKITGVKAQYYPFAAIIRKFNVPEAAIQIGRGLKIRGGFADFGNHVVLLLGWLVSTRAGWRGLSKDGPLCGGYTFIQGFFGHGFSFLLRLLAFGRET